MAIEKVNFYISLPGYKWHDLDMPIDEYKEKSGGKEPPSHWIMLFYDYETVEESLNEYFRKYKKGA